MAADTLSAAISFGINILTVKPLPFNILQFWLKGKGLYINILQKKGRGD